MGNMHHVTFFMAFVKVLRFRLSGRRIHIATQLRSGGSSGLGWLVEQSLVLLLGLDESLLEKVGVCGHVSLASGSKVLGLSLLSELAKRIAKVTASASPSETSAAAFQTQDLSDPTFGESFISGTTVFTLEYATKPEFGLYIP